MSLVTPINNRLQSPSDADPCRCASSYPSFTIAPARLTAQLRLATSGGPCAQPRRFFLRPPLSLCDAFCAHPDARLSTQSRCGLGEPSRDEEWRSTAEKRRGGEKTAACSSRPSLRLQKDRDERFVKERMIKGVMWLRLASRRS